MDKTITLTSDEISSITLAIYDKVMNLSQAVLICGAELTPNAQQRIGVSYTLGGREVL